MAGEVEDPIGFQGECLPTGSISFGKFESEALSWERRSSFSHNRYLEEVEKFSTPGSVTQKKAYFEAHFKKRGLFRQASSASQSSGEGRAPECEGEDQVNCTDADENSCIEDVQSKELGDRENGTDESESRCLNDAKCNELQYQENGLVCDPWYDDKLLVAEEHTVKESGKGVEVDLFTGSLDGQASIDVKETSESHLQRPGSAEPDPTMSGCALSSVTVGNQVPVEHEAPSILDEVHLVKVDMQKQDPYIETDNPSRVKATPKSSTKRSVKSETKNQPSNAKRLQRPPGQDNLVKAHLRPEVNGHRRKKSEKQPLFVSSATPTISRFMKSEDPKNSKVKRISLSKSENDIKTKKGGITPQSTIGRTTTPMAPTPSRPTRVISSAKPDLKTSSTGVESKSSNLSGMRIKEVMAKMKEFRKSLDFKAMPMPSFYREAVPRTPAEKTTARPLKTAQVIAGHKDAPRDGPARSTMSPARSTMSRNTKAHSTFNPSSTPRAVPATKDGTVPRRGGGVGDASARSKKNERTNANSNNHPRR